MEPRRDGSTPKGCCFARPLPGERADIGGRGGRDLALWRGGRPSLTALRWRAGPGRRDAAEREGEEQELEDTWEDGESGHEVDNVDDFGGDADVAKEELEELGSLVEKVGEGGEGREVEEGGADADFTRERDEEAKEMEQVKRLEG